MKNNSLIRWKNQDEQCFIGQLPTDPIFVTATHLSFCDIVSLKKTCHGAYKKINFLTITPDNIKNKNYLLHYKLKENASLCTRILRHYAYQHQELSNLFNSSRDPLTPDFLTKTNAIKAIINAVWSIHPNPSLLIQSDPHDHYEEQQNIDHFEGLISSLLLKPTESANIHIQFQQLQHFLSRENYTYTSDDILAINNKLLEYHQFPKTGGLLECLCRLGDIDIVDTFLSTEDRGINYYEQDTIRYHYDGYKTALEFACKHGKYKLAKFLIKKGAKIHNTLIYPNVLSFLIQRHQQDYSANAKMDNQTFYKLITLLIKNNVDPNVTFSPSEASSLIGRAEEVPLIYFSVLGKGDIDFAHLFLKHGVNHIMTAHNSSILHLIRCKHKIADNCAHIQIASLFLQKYPDIIDIANTEGNTALHSAVYHNCASLIELLLKKGANPNIFNKEGETPLSLVEDPYARPVYNENDSQVVKTLLLQHGATPVHILNLKHYAKVGAKCASIGIFFIAAYQCFKKLFEN